MRASRTYGSVRGARHETRVPTATETARVHHAARRRGGGVAARGAGAAAAMPVIGVPRRRSPDASRATVCGFPPGPQRHRLCRGRECRDRISLGGRVRFDRLPDIAAELVAPTGRRDRRGGRQPAALAAKAATRRSRSSSRRRRPGQARSRRQPRAAGRQPDRDQSFQSAS